MIQLTDVQVFLEIVSTGSFSAAARALRMPKSSVARQIARLEEEVGCLLLNRSTRAVTLTADGARFFPHARRLLDDGLEAQNIMRSGGKGASGLLSVAATGLIGRTFVAPFLPAFLDRHPALRVALWLGPDRHEIGSEAGQVDIAIRLRSVGTPDIGCRKLGEIEFLTVASPDYVAASGVPKTPQDLSDHRIVELGPALKQSRLILHRGEETANVSYTPRIHMDDPEAVRLALLAGAGIAILPAFLVRADVASGALSTVLPDWKQPAAPIHVLYRTQVAPPVRVRAYIDYLFETVKLNQLWLSTRE